MKGEQVTTLDPAALKPGAMVRILPAGLFRSHDGRPEKLPGWMVDDAAGLALAASKPKGSTEFMIDYEHQSINAGQNGKPVPAAGWFRRLVWRKGEGVFMAGITWTEKAREMIASLEYRHISPVFEFDRLGNVIRVISVALTNTPALTGLTDLAAARAVLSTQFAGGADMSPDDLARFEHWFGFAPHGSKGQSAPCVSIPPSGSELAGMSPDDQARYKKFFGPAFAAIGKPIG